MCSYSENTAGLDGVNYLFGYPIAHSMSPLLHQTVYSALNLRWEQQFLESKDIAKFLRLTEDPKFFGILIQALRADR